MCGDLEVQRRYALLKTSEGESIETQRYINYHVSALDSLGYLSHVGRHRPRVRKGRRLKPHYRAHVRRLAVRNPRARRTPIRVHHHPPLLAPFVGRAYHSHERERCRYREQHLQFERRLLLYLDADRARRDRALLRRPLS